MSNTIKDNRSLFSKLLSQWITLEVSFHWLTFVISCIYWLISSRITLLIFPILDFEGFIKRHEIFGKSSLWSFIVIYASVSCSFSILSDMGSYFVILLAWLFTLFSFSRSDFLYAFVIFSFSSFLYSLGPNLYTCRDLSAETNTLSLFFICFMSLLSLSWKLLFIFVNSMFFYNFQNLLLMIRNIEFRKINNSFQERPSWCLACNFVIIR